MAEFIPRPNGDFAQWVRLQKTQRVPHGATLGLSPTDITRQDGEDDAMVAASARADVAQAASKSATDARDTLRTSYTTARRAEIARAKTHPAYTDAIGKACEWVAPESAGRGDDLQPILTATRIGGFWSFAWTKLAQDYLKIYRRPVGATDWGRFLAIDSRSPYVDTETGLTGNYEYYGQLYDADDNAVGQPSAVVIVQHG